MCGVSGVPDAATVGTSRGPLDNPLDQRAPTFLRLQMDQGRDLEHPAGIWDSLQSSGYTPAVPPANSKLRGPLLPARSHRSRTQRRPCSPPLSPAAPPLLAAYTRRRGSRPVAAPPPCRAPTAPSSPLTNANLARESATRATAHLLRVSPTRFLLPLLGGWRAPAPLPSDLDWGQHRGDPACATRSLAGRGCVPGSPLHTGLANATAGGGGMPPCPTLLPSATRRCPHACLGHAVDLRGDEALGPSPPCAPYSPTSAQCAGAVAALPWGHCRRQPWCPGRMVRG